VIGYSYSVLSAVTELWADTVAVAIVFAFLGIVAAVRAS
jgi:hypothetical protein